MTQTIQRRSSSKWQDWLNLLLAAWLFVSPWVLSFDPNSPTAAAVASWNAWVLGVVIGVFAIAALIRARPWEEWINLIAGVWVFISPWVLGFSVTHGVAAWDCYVIGALVFILSVWDLNTQPQMAERHI
ncbi:MAG TPA: SPW repeat protein [Pseudolabrys sp.]|nr:SPW repeat protein [Pseudolabrys sp.]